MIEKNVKNQLQERVLDGKLRKPHSVTDPLETRGGSSLPYLNIVHGTSCLEYRNEGDGDLESLWTTWDKVLPILIYPEISALRYGALTHMTQDIRSKEHHQKGRLNSLGVQHN